jgi:hypothetical protein
MFGDENAHTLLLSLFSFAPLAIFPLAEHDSNGYLIEPGLFPDLID